MPAILVSTLQKYYKSCIFYDILVVDLSLFIILKGLLKNVVAK